MSGLYFLQSPCRCDAAYSKLRLLDASVFLETLRAASLAQCGRRLPRHDDVGSFLTSFLSCAEKSRVGKCEWKGLVGGRQSSLDGPFQGEMTDQELLLLLDIKSRRDDGASCWRRDLQSCSPPPEHQTSRPGALETEGFLDPPKAHRLAAYARALGEIRCSDEETECR